MIKNDIVNLIKPVLEKEKVSTEKLEVETSEHADYSANIALRLGRLRNYQSPEEIAKFLVAGIKKNDVISKAEVAKPGFINFTLNPEYVARNIQKIIEQDSSFGTNNVGQGVKVQVEFISANPTGPLTLGNGRGAFTGDALANTLEMSEFDIEREYYLNDRGNQVDLLGKSIANQLLTDYPDDQFKDEDLYKGEYIKELAGEFESEFSKPKQDYRKIAERALDLMISQTKKLITDKLKVYFDVWFSEKSLYEKGLEKQVLEILKSKKLVYHKEGSIWFKTTSLGDDKDRVLVKSDGEYTYFLSDVIHKAYLAAAKFDKLILLLGADHHGYQNRLQAAMTALDQKGKLDIIILQLVRLFKNGEEFRMSKRAGTFVTLEELIDEVGLDATRFFFNMHSADTHIDFDINLAKEKSSKNPVYYVQYAHARMNSILEKAKKPELDNINWLLLKEDAEQKLAKKLIQFPDLVADIGKNYNVHNFAFYAIEVADLFHKFYEQIRVLGDNSELTRSRLGLVRAAKITLRNCLSILGVSAPERM